MYGLALYNTISNVWLALYNTISNVWFSTKTLFQMYGLAL